MRYSYGMWKLATLVYVKRPGQTLMIHRIKKAADMHAGKWNGLGGKLEPGESPEECAVREVCEESGLRIVRPELRGVLTFPAFRAGEDWYAFVFTARTFTGELTDSPEGVLAWIDDDRLLSLTLWEGDRIFLPWLAGERFFSGKFSYSGGRLVGHSVVFYPQAPASDVAPAATASPEADHVSAPPVVPSGYTPRDDTYCWVCDGPVIKRHCKIVCPQCGFTRDCSDP